MKHKIQRVLVLSGVLLLASACAMMIFWQWNTRKQSQDCVQTLRALLPEPRNAALEERRDNRMPVLSLDGADFIGIVEIPRYGSSLPVCADWGNPIRNPHCLGGSLYDGTLQIGGASNAGQFDFFRELSVGDQICFTDMEGNRYTLAVSDLRYAKHADQEALQRCDASLTLFIKNIYAFEYLIVFCSPA